jgi:transcriptional regulator with XRE-family HTH domain
MMLEFDGTKLKELREQRKLTKTALAAEVGKTVNHIWNYENGMATPPSETLLSLIEFFGVSAQDLSKTKEVALGN